MNQPQSYGNLRGKGSWVANWMSRGKRQMPPGTNNPRSQQRNPHQHRKEMGKERQVKFGGLEVKQGNSDHLIHNITQSGPDPTPVNSYHGNLQHPEEDGTTQVPESAILVICHSCKQHQTSHTISVSTQTPVPQLWATSLKKV